MARAKGSCMHYRKSDAKDHARRHLKGIRAAALVPFTEDLAIDETGFRRTTGTVRVAAFGGENADAANGRPMGDGIRAFTPWGEIAYVVLLAGDTRPLLLAPTAPMLRCSHRYLDQGETRASGR